MSDRDVIIIGGGPAGAAAATFLVRTGYRVALFERERFPRFHVGESLIPGASDLLAELGVEEEIERAGFMRKFGGRLISPHGHTIKFDLGNIQEHLRKPYTFQVLRSEFDKILLENCKRAGVDVAEGAEVIDVLAADGRVQGVVVASEAGGSRRVTAPVVVDATGRDTLLATRFALKQPVATLTKASLYAHYEGVARETGRDEGALTVAMFRHGWFWMIPMTPRLDSIGVVLESEYVRNRASGLEAFFDESIAQCAFVATRMTHARRVTRVHAIPTLAYIAREFVGDGFLIIGDAAGFLDPIFAAGVYFALKAGKLAAQQIHEAFQGGGPSRAALLPYEQRLRREIHVVLGQIQGWYRLMDREARGDGLIPLMSRFGTLRRSFTYLFSGQYDRLDPDGPCGMVQMLERPLVRPASVSASASKGADPNERR
jgi:flavin-dependent dehydrogenase